MSRRRNRNTNRANNSNLVGLVATVIKKGDKNVGQRVVISNVLNLDDDTIVEVFLLNDKEMNKFCLQISDLRLFSRERSQKILLENVIDGLWMDVVNKAINGDEGKRHSETSSLVKELDNIAECFGEFAKWCESTFGGKDNNEPQFEEPKADTKDDSKQNYLNHLLEGRVLIAKCSTFCRDYKVSPIYFISELSKHLYCMHEKYVLKDKK